MLDAATITDMRTVQREFMDDTATIVYLTSASDGQGGYTVSGCTTASYPCRLRDVMAREQDVSGRWVQRTQTTLTLPHDATVSASALAYVDGLCYRILGVDSDKTWNTALRCPVERWS